MVVTHDRYIAVIEDLLKLPAETNWVEFKSGNHAPERIAKTISAVSNSARIVDRPNGYMLWGIKDETKDVVGTNFEPSKEKCGSEPLEMWLTKHLDPCPSFSFHKIKYKNKNVILCEIPSATYAPVTFNKQAYVRIGSATPLMSEHRAMERELWSRLQTFAWEKGIAAQYVTQETVLEQLDYASYFELTAQPLPENKTAILDRMQHDRLIEKDAGDRWNILNLGAILFAKRLSYFESSISRKGLRVVEYDGLSKIRTKRRRDETKGYASGFAEIMSYINGLLPKNEHIGQAFREEITLYPEIAIRELVANALIHQDMTVTGAGPVVEIYSDRLEISNPGAPLNDPKRLIDLPPRSRNEALASLMRRMRICEEGGTGLKKVVAAIELYQSPPPDFVAEGHNMRATVFAPREFMEMTSNERLRAAYQHAVLQYLSSARLTNISLRKRLGIADQNMAQASRIIKQASQAGLIRPADPDAPRTGYVPFWA